MRYFGDTASLSRFVRVAMAALIITAAHSGAQAQDGRQKLELSQIHKGRPADFYHLEANQRPAICGVVLAALNEPWPTAHFAPAERDEEFLLGSSLGPKWQKVTDELSWHKKTADFTNVRILDGGGESVVYRRHWNYSSNYFSLLFATDLELKPGTAIDVPAHHRITGPVVKGGRFDGAYENELQISIKAVRRADSDVALAEDLARLLFPHSQQMLGLAIIDGRAYVLVSKTDSWRKPITVALLEFQEPRRATILCHFRSRFRFD